MNIIENNFSKPCTVTTIEWVEHYRPAPFQEVDESKVVAYHNHILASYNSSSALYDVRIDENNKPSFYKNCKPCKATAIHKAIIKRLK